MANGGDSVQHSTKSSHGYLHFIICIHRSIVICFRLLACAMCLCMGLDENTVMML